ncbi:MAG: hypothetical protein QOE01_3011 [Actinomycetota bacterium]|nr:hypothetical protein [Actinomycetota bacterium]
MGAVCAAALVLSACSGSKSDNGSPTAAPSTTPPQKRPLAFTGELSAVVPTYGSLVVKMDNTDSARPQIGAASADLVVEELVEGGLTRLALFFDSRMPKKVEPVRSLRNSDVGIVSPTHGMLAASGGAHRALRAVSAAGIPTVLDSGPAFSRDNGRPAPYNLVLKPSALAKRLAALDPPPAYLQWAKPAAPIPGGKRVTRAQMTFSGVHTTSWRLRHGRWQRSVELAGHGQAFRPQNLLVLRVKTIDAGYRDPAGNPVPETVTTGHGKMVLITYGRAIPGTWSKGGPSTHFQLHLPGGKALLVPPGKTWIELVPVQGKVVLH